MRTDGLIFQLREALVRLGLGLGHALSFLPLSWHRRLGLWLGELLLVAARRRRQIAETNLALCFPDSSPEEIREVARRHFVLYAQSMLDRFRLFRLSRPALERWVPVKGWSHWEAAQGGPVIVLAPHFMGLDAGGLRLSLLKQFASMYSLQSSPALDAFALAGRGRFHRPMLFSRQDGVGGLVRALRKQVPLYYLPDLDFGTRDSLFVEFFGQPAATVTGLVRLAQISGAQIVPFVTRLTPTGYQAEFFPAWRHSKEEDLATAVQKMNDFIEREVRRDPAQYLWTHRRFKSRPEGYPALYP